MLGPVDGGRLDFTIQGQPCALDLPADGRQLLGCAAKGDWLSLVPEMIHPDYEDWFWARLADWDDPLTMHECWRLVHHLSEDMFAMPWWAACRLAASAQHSWLHFSVWSVSNGFDPCGAPAHRILSAAFAWLLAGAKEEKDAAMIERKIMSPPIVPMRKAKIRKSSPLVPPGFSREEQAAAFAAAFANLGGGDDD